MRIRSLATAVALVGTCRSSISHNIPIRALIGEHDVLQTPYSDLLKEATMLVRRQDNNAGEKAPVQLNPNGTLNVTAWNAATDAACVKTLTHIEQSTNPSGNCVCYNIPALDESTGVFEADLRLYRVSAPRDAFASVKQQDVRVSVEYNGASVSTLGNATNGSGGTVKRATGLNTRADTSNPQLLQTYMFVGQIDRTKMKENMSIALMEQVLIPTFTLSAATANGSIVKTNVSLNEAAFLTGVFSEAVVLSNFAAAQAAVLDEMQGLRNGTVAFILPGTQILIFPIGAIITSIWLFLGLVAYGYGTFNRIQYAETYRRRSGRSTGAKTF